MGSRSRTSISCRRAAVTNQTIDCTDALAPESRARLPPHAALPAALQVRLRFAHLDRRHPGRSLPDLPRLHRRHGHRMQRHRHRLRLSAGVLSQPHLDLGQERPFEHLARGRAVLDGLVRRPRAVDHRSRGGGPQRRPHRARVARASLDRQRRQSPHLRLHLERSLHHLQPLPLRGEGGRGVDRRGGERAHLGPAPA